MQRRKKQQQQQRRMWSTLDDMNDNDIWRWQQHQQQQKQRQHQHHRKGEYLLSTGGGRNSPLLMNVHPSRRTDTGKRVGRGTGGSNARFHGKRFMEVDDEESTNMIFHEPPSKRTRISRQSSHSSSSSSACDASGSGGTSYHCRSNLQRPSPVMRDWSGLSILSYNDERNIRNSLVVTEDDKDDDEPYTVGLPQLKPLDEKAGSKTVQSKNNDTTRATSSKIYTYDQTSNTPPPPPPPSPAPTRRASSQQKKKVSSSAAASPSQQASTTVHSRVTVDKTETNVRRRSSLRRVSVDSVPITPDDDDEVCLGEGFVPGDWDVVCGRGKNWSEYVSNRRFRVLVAIYLNEYFETISRTRKSIVINTIVTTIQNAGGEGFVKKKGSQWFRITSKEAREKTSHCLRDCLADPQSEQNQWSIEKRNEKLQEAQNNVLRSLELMR